MSEGYRAPRFTPRFTNVPRDLFRTELQHVRPLRTRYVRRCENSSEIYVRGMRSVELFHALQTAVSTIVFVSLLPPALATDMDVVSVTSTGRPVARAIHRTARTYAPAAGRQVVR